MDIVYLGLIGLLWGALALLVLGFTKLDQPSKDRP